MRASSSSRNRMPAVVRLPYRRAAWLAGSVWSMCSRMARIGVMPEPAAMARMLRGAVAGGRTKAARWGQDLEVMPGGERLMGPRPRSGRLRRA